MQTETADMQQHRAAYMFKEAAAKRAIDEVRKLKKEWLPHRVAWSNVSFFKLLFKWVFAF